MRISSQPTNRHENSKLKSLAGLIQSLSYSEMKQFSQKLTSAYEDSEVAMPEALLAVSADILHDASCV